MQLFDSHCHLDDKRYTNDLIEVLARAREAGVKKMMSVGVSAQSSRRAASLAETHPGVYASVGIHPHEAASCSEKALTELCRLAERPCVRAWGEIGLDFNRMYSPEKDQEKWFIRQIEVSGELHLPVIFHERDSGGRFNELLNAHFSSHRKGVVHCFSGNRSDLENYLEKGLYIGVTGILTVKERGALLRSLVPHVPEEKLLIETDAPYLVPAPERNKFRRNEPAFVKSVLIRLAKILEMDPDELAQTTFNNACRLFDIS